MKINEIIKQIQEREIKFRCYFKDLEMMAYSGFGDENTTDLNREIKNFKRKQNLMQYTGLKDKNGTEIYEGDIVRDNKGAIWVITHSNGAFWRGVPSLDNRGGIMPVYLLYDGEDFEVIGNIFENPELLGG